MQRRLTWILFSAAAGLFALIYFVDRRIPSTAERMAPKHLLPFPSVGSIVGVSVDLGPGGAVRARRTGGSWTLTQPAYPARDPALEAFATNLVELRILDTIPAREATLEGQKSFGFEPPRAIVEVEGETNRFRFEVGKIAPLTSNLYLRLPESGTVVLVHSALLQGLPKDTNEWRTPALVQLSGLDFDHLQVRGGLRSFELGRNTTNNTWQISKPMPARANQEQVLELLRLLKTAETSQFVTDSPGSDLERFGLQTPDVELSFLAGTNRVYTIEFGNSPTNRTNEVYARLLGNTNVVLASRDLVNFLKQPYKNFHDPRLLVLNPAAVDRIMIQSRETFALQRQPTGAWTVDDAAKTPIDRDLFRRFLGALSELQILDIVKEVPAETELKGFGLIPPSASYAFFQKLTNGAGLTTNILFSEVAFGGAQADKIYVRRSDETPIYLTSLATALELPKRGFELRDRRIWRLATNDIASVTIIQGGMTNRVNRSVSGWGPDEIANARIEEAVFRLANLEARDWVEKGANRLPTYGLATNALQIIVETRSAKGAEQNTLLLGRRTLQKDLYASVTFPGETDPTIFEFAGELYQMLTEALPLPK